jgi:hypothetical protein
LKNPRSGTLERNIFPLKKPLQEKETGRLMEGVIAVNECVPAAPIGILRFDEDGIPPTDLHERN